MKYKILPALFLLSCLISINSFAQSKKFFAVTGDQYGSVNWITFRQIDLEGIAPVKTLYVPADNSSVSYDALTNKPIANPVADQNAKSAAPQTCGCLNNRMVAAIAYDGVNNRLYYTPMLSNQLRYLDLNSDQPKSYVITSQLLKSFSNQPGEASVVTRMCFAANGFGYALTNDGEHLIRFSTGNTTTVTDLGSLIDAKNNGTNSVKAQFKNWGGDLIADAYGSLYLFTIQRSVFKINPLTKIATYLGDIKNIPVEYTVNAVMVEKDAQVIVGSSTNISTYYRVDLTTLQASELAKNTTQVYNVSDFANANLAFGKTSSVNSADAKVSSDKSLVSIYPNPVSNRNLNMQFANFANDKYIIQLTEMEGKALLQKEVAIHGSQTERIQLPKSIVAGAYLISVINSNGETMYNNKVIVN